MLCMMKKALVVDDDEVFCRNLVNALGRCFKNCAVYTARNGKEAAKIMEHTPVDFVITDLNMPVMGGYEFVSHARTHYPDVPILVMSGTKTPEVETRLRTLGVSRCIEKQFNVKEMVPMILDELRGNISDVSTKQDAGFI
jgi:CheY-like chemotaxis protein